MRGQHRVTVLMGGTSPERDISLISGKAIAQGLRDAGETVFEVVANDHELRELDHLPVDVVFPALHGTWGEDGGVQELLESRNLPYVGSGVEASRLGMDKLGSKETFQAHGVPTPRYAVITTDHSPDDVVERVEGLGLPVVVKPRGQGSSIGVHIIRSHGEVADAVSDALGYGQEALLEEFIRGRELTVGILDGEPLPIIELRSRREFFDFEAKYEAGVTEHVFDVPLGPESYRRVQDVALGAYRALGCRGFARVDMRLSEPADPYVLEVNTIPGFTPVSLFPEAARRAGLEFPDLCYRLVSIALRDCVKVRHPELTSERGG